MSPACTLHEISVQHRRALRQKQTSVLSSMSNQHGQKSGSSDGLRGVLQSKEPSLEH